jgi:hypothetical protein
MRARTAHAQAAALHCDGARVRHAVQVAFQQHELRLGALQASHRHELTLALCMHPSPLTCSAARACRSPHTAHSTTRGAQPARLSC